MSSYYEILLCSCENDDFTELRSRYYYLDFTENQHQTQKEKTIQKNYELFISEIPRCQVCGGFIDGNIQEEKIHNCCKVIDTRSLNIEIAEYQL